MAISFSYNLFNYQFIPSRGCAMSQPISHWNLATKAQVQFHASLWGICGGKRALGQADIGVIVKLWVILRFTHLNFLGRNIHIKDSGCLCTDEEWHMWTSQQHTCYTSVTQTALHHILSSTTVIAILWSGHTNVFGRISWNSKQANISPTSFPIICLVHLLQIA